MNIYIYIFNYIYIAYIQSAKLQIDESSFCIKMVAQHHDVSLLTFATMSILSSQNIPATRRCVHSQRSQHGAGKDHSSNTGQVFHFKAPSVIFGRPVGKLNSGDSWFRCCFKRFNTASIGIQQPSSGIMRQSDFTVKSEKSCWKSYSWVDIFYTGESNDGWYLSIVKYITLSHYQNIKYLEIHITKNSPTRHHCRGHLKLGSNSCLRGTGRLEWFCPKNSCDNRNL